MHAANKPFSFTLAGIRPVGGPQTAANTDAIQLTGNSTPIVILHKTHNQPKAGFNRLNRWPIGLRFGVSRRTGIGQTVVVRRLHVAACRRHGLWTIAHSHRWPNDLARLIQRFDSYASYTHCAASDSEAKSLRIGPERRLHMHVRLIVNPVINCLPEQYESQAIGGHESGFIRRGALTGFQRFKAAYM